MPPEGTEMSLTFDLPGVEHGLEPTARIVWRKFEAGQTGRSQSGIGVRFVALDGSASRELRVVIRALTRVTSRATFAPWRR